MLRILAGKNIRRATNDHYKVCNHFCLSLFILSTCNRKYRKIGADYQHVFSTVNVFLVRLAASCIECYPETGVDERLTDDEIFRVRPLGRIISVIPTIKMNDWEVDALRDALRNEYSYLSVVKRVFVNVENNVTIDCRRLRNL